MIQSTQTLHDEHSRTQITSTGDDEPQEVEHIAFQHNGTLVISGIWRRNLAEQTITYRRTELMWNYADEKYNRYSYTYEISLKGDGKTVDHSNKHWLQHAEDAAQKVLELRPRTDDCFSILDASTAQETAGVSKWADPDIHHQTVADDLQER